MKKILLAVTVFLALLLFNACSDAELNQEPGTQEEFSVKKALIQEIEADASIQSDANEKLTKIINSFGITKNRFQEDVPKYPDYYGGAYIEQNGQLVVLINGEMGLGKQAVTAIIGNGNIEFKKADYSFARLTEIMNSLNEFVLSKKNIAVSDNFKTFSLIDKENRIVVELDDYSDQKIFEFRKSVLNSPAIVFTKSSGKTELEAQLEPGCKAAKNSSGTSYGSFGFRAKRNSDNVAGMVTAGHVIGVGQTLYYGGTAIGTCSASQQSGSVDAAFIPISNPTSYTPSNTLCTTSSSILSTSTSLPGAGTIVNKRGITTGRTSGSITSTNATTTTTAGITYTNLTSAGYSSSGGDSGGIVYTYISSTGTLYTVGVHLGSNSSNAFFSKASNVLADLGLYRY
ncbi:hypothetical protein [Zunongwangia profunda]|uniref:hypothetical protein n=1 Tax=Zunongwangia profunda TaxID=398743 RepID=UPI0030D6E99F|tara:strand:+ start:1651 stop:2850 length:1200 start_codon:yes stop_codon:yes gene_type:complete